MEIVGPIMIYTPTGLQKCHPHAAPYDIPYPAQSSRYPYPPYILPGSSAASILLNRGDHLFKECEVWEKEIRVLWRKVGNMSGEGRYVGRE